MNKYEVYVLGDMNIGLLKHHTHLQTRRYLDILYSHNLLPVVTKPTRITSHTATLIKQNCSGLGRFPLDEKIPV